MDVRRIAPKEWQALREIRLAALTDSPEAFASTVAAESAYDDRAWVERCREGATSDDRATFVATEPGGTWVGLAGAFRPGEPPADAELVSMWVAPAARGQGLGAALVAAACRWLGETGARTVGLWVTHGNDGARALYERAGFVPTGASAPLPSNPCKNELRMLRKL